jgi:hypothetical protein
VYREDAALTRRRCMVSARRGARDRGHQAPSFSKSCCVFYLSVFRCCVGLSGLSSVWSVCLAALSSVSCLLSSFVAFLFLVPVPVRFGSCSCSFLQAGTGNRKEGGREEGGSLLSVVWTSWGWGCQGISPPSFISQLRHHCGGLTLASASGPVIEMD